MEKAQFVINKMHGLYHLAIRTFDAAGNLIGKPYDGFEKEDPVVCDRLLLDQIHDSLTQDNMKCGIYLDEDHAYSAFHIDNCDIILGPVTFNEKAEDQNKDYLAKHKTAKKTLLIPNMSLSYLEKLTGFVYGIVLDDYESDKDLFQDRNYLQDEMHRELAEYTLTTSEKEQIHFSFEEEKHQAEQIIHGEFGSNIHQEDDRNIYTKKFIGKLAKTPIKQVEYECVCWITLMTRYAIEAGVSDAKSYALSDVSLQKLSVAKTTVEMRHIFDSSMKEFDLLIQEAKVLKGKDSPYIDRCKDYIAKHIYEKITLEQIAEEVGLHPVYLSRLFSQCIGTPISHFIMEEKVKLSCNLLMYSGKSIAEIAEYMNLSPQSYFTRVFKKVMAQSPDRYRREHRDKKFYGN